MTERIPVKVTLTTLALTAMLSLQAVVFADAPMQGGADVWDHCYGLWGNRNPPARFGCIEGGCKALHPDDDDLYGECINNATAEGRRKRQLQMDEDTEPVTYPGGGDATPEG